jgi:stalled ribosome rescue protein Dom34
MSEKNKKQFGIWMDSHQATIIGREKLKSGEFVVLAHAMNAGSKSNSNENTSNNSIKTLRQTFFKKISSHMQNIDELHVTGTGQVQEQFVRYMAETPQFKSVVAKHSTTTKMSKEKLLEFFTAKFN